MTIDNRIFDDLTRVAGGAASVLSALGKQLGEGLKEQMGEKMGDKFQSPFSARTAANDDIDRLQGVVTRLRMEQEEMKKRIAELESLLGQKAKSKTTATPKTKAKAATKPVKKTASPKSKTAKRKK